MIHNFHQAQPPSGDQAEARYNPSGHHTLSGDFRLHRNFHSGYLPADRDVLVYLPPGYEADPQHRYPVFYLQDGQNLFDGATSFVPGQEWRVDETAEGMIRDGRIEPLIIVGIYNTRDRMAEYTPTGTKGTGGGKADLYGQFLTNELKPFIDSHYRTLQDAGNTGLGGSSLGGLLTMYLGLQRPDIFGKVAVMSPSAWWDRRMIVRKVNQLHGKPNVRVWLDIGTAESKNPKRTVDDTRKLRDALEKKGWVHGQDLAYLEAPGGGHNEGSWATRFGSVLEFLFPKH